MKDKKGGKKCECVNSAEEYFGEAVILIIFLDTLQKKNQLYQPIFFNSRVAYLLPGKFDSAITPSPHTKL